MSKQYDSTEAAHGTSAEADVMPPEEHQGDETKSAHWLDKKRELEARTRQYEAKQLREIKARAKNPRPYSKKQVATLKEVVGDAIDEADSIGTLPLYTGELVARLIATIEEGKAA